MIQINKKLEYQTLATSASDVFTEAGPKIKSLVETWNPLEGSPTTTDNGRYRNQAWSDWTQGFQYGMALFQYEATGEMTFLQIGVEGIRERMPKHLTHIGVHDHGFTNVSSYGNLLRLMNEKRIPENTWERDYLELALKVSGAVQAARWTYLDDDLGYVYSAFGPHCLFTDTIRSMRSLLIAHDLGHCLMGEQDVPISLLKRVLQHSETTARFAVYRGEHRDYYDEPGRVSHQALFNINNGRFHCPNTQQGYSPFSTWTRAQSWALLGFTELAEYFLCNDHNDIGSLRLPYYSDKKAVLNRFIDTGRAISDHIIDHSCTDGIPYWDTGAPGLVNLPGYSERPADPFNAYEPVDSPTAAINSQGMLRLAAVLAEIGDERSAEHYRQAGLTIASTLFREPYLSRDLNHQGLLIHSVYSRPRGLDTIQKGQSVPNGESSMWGDYHLMELALYIKRMAEMSPPLRFFTQT